MLALVTDSTCGLTRVEADELGVIVLPMTYSVDGVRYSEAPVGENGDYGSLISAGSRVETEAVHPSAFERVFRERLAAGDDVLCVTISSRLSGTFRSAEEAAAAVDPSGKRVAAFDSWNTAGALEFLVRRAHELAAGGCSLSEVVAGLAEARRGTRIVFSVPDMGALFRSGRLGAIRRAVATKLNRYPVMTLHEGESRSTATGAARAAWRPPWCAARRRGVASSWCRTSGRAASRRARCFSPRAPASPRLACA